MTYRGIKTSTNTAPNIGFELHLLSCLSPFEETSSDATLLLLKQVFESLDIDQIESLEADISAMIPQLQVLMSQKDVVELSRELINVLTVKVRNFTAPMRHVYIKYFTRMLTFLCHSSDLQRLQRQAAIQSNVDPVKSTTFEMMAYLLEPNASGICTLVLNIERTQTIRTRFRSVIAYAD
ncbi:hypothetical protein MBM_04050 [Drepanopeziza brunnea f. sp. 'multigermtubi' MB_m1]|uniref:Uncharacterized protein n=1 Tax=Marssonina brunnea f. sp. multigermtubi (strain MB_m1) TaxID=1072389 RepID=K1WXA4_MARBU|nr:uncharacterized protein MBM_04050 [Drepanopeziza brunnea f. sp. 'multigermtubi' MB_m1]EKD17681.1 hypothetical protein MBM_04050 [Drepanopeziza brunnea f. sp. 'multigermtubi' MB_m1]